MSTRPKSKEKATADRNWGVALIIAAFCFVMTFISDATGWRISTLFFAGVAWLWYAVQVILDAIEKQR